LICCCLLANDLLLRRATVRRSRSAACLVEPNRGEGRSKRRVHLGVHLDLLPFMDGTWNTGRIDSNWWHV